MAARASARKEPMGLTAGITVMFTPEEKVELRRAAFESGARSTSDFIRAAAMKALERTTKKIPALKATG